MFENQAREEPLMTKQKGNQNVRMATSEQLKQLIAIIVQAIPVRITAQQAQYWIGHAKELATKIRTIFQVADPYREQVAAWEQFYRDHFGLTVDLSGLAIPARRDGFTRLIVVMPGVTIESVFAACGKKFKVWRWTSDNLDQITTSVRSATSGPYAIWIQDNEEADGEFANKSYDQLKAAGHNGITLLERLLLELVYFTEMGKHLDINIFTLCAGSLYRDGCAPSVRFGGGYGEVYVDWCYSFSAYPHLRSREAVV